MFEIENMLIDNDKAFRSFIENKGLNELRIECEKNAFLNKDLSILICTETSACDVDYKVLFDIPITQKYTGISKKDTMQSFSSTYKSSNTLFYKINDHFYEKYNCDLIFKLLCPIEIDVQSDKQLQLLKFIGLKHGIIAFISEMDSNMPVPVLCDNAKTITKVRELKIPSERIYCDIPDCDIPGFHELMVRFNGKYLRYTYFTDKPSLIGHIYQKSQFEFIDWNKALLNEELKHSELLKEEYTELIKYLYNRVFFKEDDIIPFGLSNTNLNNIKKAIAARGWVV